MVSASAFFSGWRDWLGIYVLLIVTYYVVVRKVAPDIHKESAHSYGRLMRRTGQVLGTVLLVLILFSWHTGALSFGYTDGNGTESGIRNLPEVMVVFLAVIGAAYFAYSYRWGINHYFFRLGVEVKLRRIEAKLLRIQQSWAQQDLPPHLLFNSLSVARGLIKKEPEKARQAMTLISKLAKYYVKQCKSPDIPLGEELEQLALLMELYALRFGTELALGIQVPEKMDGLTIIPMLLIVLLENMAQHGILTDPDRQAQLRISSVGRRTEIIAHNYVRGQSARGSEGLGIAIDNIRKQLNLRYPGKSKVQIDRTDYSFTIQLFFEQ